MTMRELSLFSGVCGGSLATKYYLGWRCLGYVENEPYCQKVIRQRIEDGLLDAAPIFGDVRKFISGGYAESYQGMVDVVTAGFPCQPFSVAGKRAGEDDERNMWPATRNVIRIVRPRWTLLENVPGLASNSKEEVGEEGECIIYQGNRKANKFIVKGSYLGRILGDLAEAGYDAKWTVLGADDCGAPHRRKRLWILAYASEL